VNFDQFELTTAFPVWMVGSWVLILALFYIALRHAGRITTLERAITPSEVDDAGYYDYQNYHRAASELVTSAVTYQAEKMAKLTEAESYVLKALELARLDDQRKLTLKLLEAIRDLRAAHFDDHPK